MPDRGYETVYSLKEEKKIAIQNAKELGYIDMYPNVVQRINNADSETEIYNILKGCRDKWYEPKFGFKVADKVCRA